MPAGMGITTLLNILEWRMSCVYQQPDPEWRPIGWCR
jgi:hypothetical protein